MSGAESFPYKTVDLAVEQLTAQRDALQRFVDDWCKRQEVLLKISFPQCSHPEAPDHAKPRDSLGARLEAPNHTILPEFSGASPSYPREVGRASDSFGGAPSQGRSSQSFAGGFLPAALRSPQKLCFRASEDSCRSLDPEHLTPVVRVRSATESAPTASQRQDRLPKLKRLSSAASVNWTTLRKSVKRALTKDLTQHDLAVDIVLSGTEDDQNRFSEIKTSLGAFIKSGRFESMIAIVIIINAVLMCVQANYDIQNLNGPSNPHVNRMELVLYIIYAAELVLRLAVNGGEYFVGANWKWNCFDLFLVAMSVYDFIVTAVAESHTNMLNLSFFRMLRLLKMLKLLRVIRLMKFFKELRLILYAVLGGVRAMFWACVLIAVISYVAGILFIQATAQYLAEAAGDVSPASWELIQLYWKDVQTAMLSLFIACTAGKEWTLIASPLRDAGPIWYGLFVAYIAFFDFVIMNTLTSLFVDTVMERSSKDLEVVIQLELEKKNEYIRMLRNFFHALDKSNRGFITAEDFENNIDNPIIQGFVSTLDIDVMNAKKFFNYLSGNGTTVVDVETFVVGCIKLKGNARSVDLIELMNTVKMHVFHHDSTAAETASRLKSLENRLKNLHTEAAKSYALTRITYQNHGGQLNAREERSMTTNAASDVDIQFDERVPVRPKAQKGHAEASTAADSSFDLSSPLQQRNTQLSL